MAMQQELYIAHEIQQSLLAPPDPAWPGLDVIAYCHPARQVGGDFYSYYIFESMPDQLEKYALAVGDVSGKGVSAALLMATSLSQFDAALALDFADPSQRLLYLDKVISTYTRARQQNCAMCYVEISVNKATGAALAQVVNAACIPPYIKRRSGVVEQPEIGGFALGQGLASETGYEQLSIDLAPGDMLILSSDGVVEANNEAGELLGFERLLTWVESGPAQEAQAMLNHLQESLKGFSGEAEQHDDLTLLVIRI